MPRRLLLLQANQEGGDTEIKGLLLVVVNIKKVSGEFLDDILLIWQG